MSYASACETKADAYGMMFHGNVCPILRGCVMVHSALPPLFGSPRRPAFLERDQQLRVDSAPSLFCNAATQLQLFRPLVNIRQRPLAPNSALVDEFNERRLTKYIGHWARKSPAAGVGRWRSFATSLNLIGQCP